MGPADSFYVTMTNVILALILFSPLQTKVIIIALKALSLQVWSLLENESQFVKQNVQHLALEPLWVIMD